jgi:GT2 family glycosyltransferase
MTPSGARISAVISTRNRASVIEDAVRGILRNDHPDFEVIVADQSADALTEAACDRFSTDPRVHYRRSATTGRSAGLNAGIRAASGALVAMTDDDCQVPPDWLRQIEAAFAVDRRIGIVFGNVLPAPRNRADGCIPSYVRQRPFLARGIRDKNQVEGLGACMAVRRSMWQSLGGFDEMLGAGARFKAGEDGDLALRALLAGHWVYETPSVWLTHYGLRKWDYLPALIDSYWRGTGAMMAKPVKAGHWPMLPLLLRLAARWATGTSTVGSSLGPRPKRTARLLSFCRGFLAGFALPVDRKTGLFAVRRLR